MKQRLIFACGLVLAIALGAWVPAFASSSTTCWGNTEYGDCYLELTGCDADSCWQDHGGAGGSIGGTNCTGFYGQCQGTYSFDLYICDGGSFYCGVHAFDPLVN